MQPDQGKRPESCNRKPKGQPKVAVLDGGGAGAGYREVTKVEGIWERES